MATLLVAEHDNKTLKDSTNKALTAAKAMGAAGSDDSGLQLANSPTLTARATEAGVILGTAAYMSPEQARGKARTGDHGQTGDRR